MKQLKVVAVENIFSTVNIKIDAQAEHVSAAGISQYHNVQQTANRVSLEKHSER